MSLINQALRKAQRDRNPSRMGSAGDNQPTGAHGGFAGSSAPQPGGFNLKLVVGISIAFALLIGLVAGLTVVLLNQDTTPTDTSAQAEAPAIPAPEQIQPLQPEVPEPTDPVITPDPSATAQAPTPAAKPAAAQPSLVEELRLAREAAEAKAAAEAEAARQAEAEARAAREKAEAEAKAKAEIQPSQEIIQWLAEAKITGVRLSGDSSKVILNGKAYGIGETVHYALGLRVMIIQEKRVLFVDENGTKYMKAL